MRFFFLLFIFVLINTQCATLRNATLLNQGDKVRIYSIRANEYLEGVNPIAITTTQKFPELNEEQLLIIFENLFFHDSNYFSGHPRPVFYKDDLKYLIPRIKKSMYKISPGKSILVVYKRLPDGNLVQTTLRTTFLFWYDKHGINIALGEVRKIILSEDLIKQYKKWGDIDSIDASDLSLTVSLDVKKPFTHKELENRSRDFWVYLNIADIDTLLKNRETPQILKELEDDGTSFTENNSEKSTSKDKKNVIIKNKELNENELKNLPPETEEVKLGNENKDTDTSSLENDEEKKPVNDLDKDKDFKFNFKINSKSNNQEKEKKEKDEVPKGKVLIKTKTSKVLKSSKKNNKGNGAPASKNETTTPAPPTPN